MDTNISAKEFEKLPKHKDLQIEVERMWQLKISIIPIVVSALGLVKMGTVKHLDLVMRTLQLGFFFFLEGVGRHYNPQL